MINRRFGTRLTACVLPLLAMSPIAAHAEQNPCIGNSVGVTGPAAFGGQAAKMGAEIAIEKINAAGGVLGKPLRFVQYDDAGAPPRGVDNTRRIALADKCVAILGGYHSTVAVAQAEPVNKIGIPYVGIMAANTKAIENGASPNYMFRVSAKDKWVARFLVEQAVKASKSGKVALLYENTGWGNGAVPDVKAAMQAAGKELVALETFNWNDQDMSPQVMRARDAGADVVLFWALDREGNQILRSMDKVGYKPTIIGAWGIAGNLGELAGPLANGVQVIQTYTFMGEMDPKKKALWDKISAKYGMKDPSEIKMGSGVGNAYDAVYILKAAIEKAGAYDWAKVREALYEVNHTGIVADYQPAFDKTDPERQDAILPKYYKLTAWQDGKLLPIEQTPYGKAP
ncbi:ABC transporter substrate-binding protein [Terrihabitans sp. PJ23]|uniref:ABC transporter substrate-binding protein n=2 Tax=Terrihabitans rhizophilus TaxID=3092662 RepID=A0ABU4RRB6_9HYPH|nr:ABC transporter substrate-binding protein [Terrihabitans sp. PJ23]MDX6807389.1 ABC transporter substrate-binding protein [Terrihabitans sp. PJ23]